MSAAFTNETDRVIHFGEDVAIYFGDNLITALRPEEVHREVRQISGLYMLWGLFWITISNCENSDCKVIPLPVGLLIGLANMTAAKRANNYFIDDLTRQSLMNKTVAPGETVYGILPIRAEGGEDLRVRWK